MKIVVLDGHATNPGDLSWNELKSLREYIIYNRTTPSEITGRAAGVDILLTNKVVFNADTIAVLPRLKYIGVLATGYNVVDIAAAKEWDIVATNIPTYSTPSVTQMVFAHILDIVQQVQYYTDEVRKGCRSSNPDLCFWDTPLIKLHGKKIGIIDLRQTSYNIARITTGFGMEVCAYTPKSIFQLSPEVRKTELDGFFVNYDITSLHRPLTDSARELINAARLKQMKSNAILISIGRGPPTNEQDLADAPNNGIILAVGSDVLPQEPPRPNNPPLIAKGCYIAPHIAWASTATRERLMQIMLDNVKTFLDRKVINAATR